MRRKMCSLRRLAAQSIGISACAEALTAQVRLLADQLVFLIQQREEAERSLTDLFLRFDESAFLLSIPGLGKVNAAGLLAHIGDTRHFSGVKQWSKLAGIVPQESTSADHHAARTPMSKKGRRGLRGVLWRASVCLVRHSDVFRRYADRLRNRSAKDHPLKKREAIGAVMNKLLRIAYALLTKRELFNEDKAMS
jgi:transposase